jgi:GGDEF domain-containing protein
MISAVDAEEMAQRLRQALAEPFVIDDRPFLAGGSIGVAHTDTTETSRLLDAGDAAMYVDKRHRRSRPAAPKYHQPRTVRVTCIQV